MSTCQEKRGQQRGALRHGTREDMFARGMRSATHVTQAVQRGNSQRGGEIAVGTSARGSFADTQAHLPTQLSCPLVERCAVLAFEGSAAETASDFQLGAWQNRPKRTEPDLNFVH